MLLNFVNADIDAVVRAIGQYTGRTFVIDPRVKGTLSLSTERPVTRQQAYDQLLTALRLQGFTIVQTGNVARVVPEADAKLQGGAVIIPKRLGTQRRSAGHAGFPACNTSRRPRWCRSCGR